MRSAWLLPCVALVGAGPASASIARALSVEALAQQADAVVLGTVTSQEAHWSRSHRQIYSWVRVRLEARWLDRVGLAGEITVLRPGGELDGLGQEIAGEPHFEVGERVVLFVRQTAHVYRLLGMSQGVFRVDGAQTAAQDLGDLALAHPGAEGRLSIGGDGEGAEPPLPLAALKRRVLAAGRAAASP